MQLFLSCWFFSEIPSKKWRALFRSLICVTKLSKKWIFWRQVGSLSTLPAWSHSDETSSCPLLASLDRSMTSPLNTRKPGYFFVVWASQVPAGIGPGRQRSSVWEGEQPRWPLPGQMRRGPSRAPQRLLSLVPELWNARRPGKLMQAEILLKASSGSGNFPPAVAPEIISPGCTPPVQAGSAR